MGTVAGIFEAASGLPQDGATCKLWTLAQFGGTRPAKDTALPAGSPVATLSGGTGTAYGGNGAYSFTGVAAGEYVVSIEWAGARVFDYHTVPADSTFRDSDYFGLSTGGTGAANASALNTALADTSVGVLILKPGTYTVAGSLTLNNRTGLKIIGYGATIQWSGTGTSTSPVAINITGTCREITIEGVRFLGDGTAANYHGAIKILTGQVVEGLSIENCHFENLTAGIWLVNASILTRHIQIRGNQWENTIGTGAGQGRGISVNVTSGEPLDLTIEGNHFDTTTLHAIEIITAISVMIRGNHFKYHRSATSTGALVPAIYCPMTGGNKIAISGNHFESCSDGCIAVTPNGGTISSVVIEGNHCINLQTDEPDITVGTSNPATNGAVEMLTLRGNIIQRSGLTSAAIDVFHALEAVIADNVIEQLLVTAANTPAIRFSGSGDSGGTSTYSDDLIVANNHAVFTTAGGSGIGIELAAAFCTSQINAVFDTNAFFGIANHFRVGASISNDNLVILGEGTDGLTFDTASQPVELPQYATVFKTYLRMTPVSKNTNATLTNKETVVWATGGAGGITLTLPVIGSGAGQIRDGTLLCVVKIDSGAGSVELLPQGSDTILHASSSGVFQLSSQHSGVILVVDDTNNAFRVVGSYGVPQVQYGKTITSADNPYSMADRDEVIWANTAGGNIEIDLLSVTGRDGRRLRIFRPSNANTLTIDPNGTETIDGGAAGAAVTLEAQANNWWDYQVEAGEWKRVGGRYT